MLFILGKPLWFPPSDGKRVSLLSAELPHKLSESPQAGGGEALIPQVRQLMTPRASHLTSVLPGRRQESFVRV